MTAVDRKIRGGVAVVTASAGAGIGSATARAFADRGFTVVVSDVHVGRTHDVAARLAEETGSLVHGYPLDVANAAAVHDTFGRIAAEVGPVDILVNNSGLTSLAPLEDLSLEDWNRVLDVSLTGHFLCMKEVIPAMKQRRSGSIVNVSSVAGWRPLDHGEAAYSSAKAGIMGLTKTAAVELGKYGVRVNAVAPGYIHNPFLKGAGFSDEWVANWLDQTALKRAGEPSEIASVIVEVATELTCMTGEVVNVSGGVYLSS